MPDAMKEINSIPARFRKKCLRILMHGANKGCREEKDGCNTVSSAFLRMCFCDSNAYKSTTVPIGTMISSYHM